MLQEVKIRADGLYLDIIWNKRNANIIYHTYTYTCENCREIVENVQYL